MNDFQPKISSGIIRKVLVPIGLFVGCAVLVFVLLNSDYFWKQLVFLIHKPTVTQTQTVSGQVEKGEPNQLSIPSLGITAPIVDPKENNEKSFQDALETGVVHYPGTAAVGELGNPYIFGHSSDFAFKGGNFKTVFALLPSIQKGAEIVVSNKDGQVFRYEVIDSRAINKDDVGVLDQQGYKEKLLTLQTSYPVGTALRRWIVVGKLKQ